MVESAQHFQITQFGLSAFQWEGGRYIARTFNFYVFPRPDDGFDTRFLSQVCIGILPLLRLGVHQLGAVT